MQDCLYAVESDEVGYLFLEEGEVRIISNGSPTLQTVPSRDWIDVEWESPDAESFEIKQTPLKGLSDRQGNDEAEKQICAHCHLVLHHESHEDTVKLVLKRPLHFNGMIINMVAQSSTCSLTCKHGRIDLMQLYWLELPLHAIPINIL